MSPHPALPSEPPPLKPELDAVCRIARTAGKLAARYFTAWHDPKPGSESPGDGALTVDMKDGDEPVTAADRAVSDLCVASLHQEFPADAVLSEEIPDDGARLKAKRTWLVDPIDGTKDFIAGRPGFAVMIGLLVGGEPTLGVVYQPLVDRLWYATRGHGAFCIEGGGPPRHLQVSTVDHLADARMVSSASVRENVVAQVRHSAGISDEVQIGSVGIKLSLVAAGERDLYINPAGRTKLWDTCAPGIILYEAGGRLTDLLGRPLQYLGELGHEDGLVATNGLLHNQALAQLAPFVARLGR